MCQRSRREGVSLRKRELTSFNILVSAFFLVLFIPHSLTPQSIQTQAPIEHTPITSFVHGEVLSFVVQSQEIDAQIKLYYRYPGIEEPQVRELTYREDGYFIFDLDTSLLPALEFEYYLEVKTKDSTFYVRPEDSLNNFSVVGESQEIMPDVPSDFPPPQEEAKRFKLPLNVMGSIAVPLKKDDSGSSSSSTDANGNVRIYTDYNKNGLGINFDSNLRLTNSPYEGSHHADLSNMMLSITKGNHRLNVGDININESEYTAYGLGRRGTDYLFNNQKTYVHIFDVSSLQPQGFSGIGIPDPNIGILGGAVGYRLFQNAVNLKAVYLNGRTDPSRGVNVGSSDFYTKSKGSVFALVEETYLFENRLNLGGEIARSDSDFNLDDNEGSQQGTAWKVMGSFAYGVFNLSGTYNYVDRNFNSIGYQYFTNDRQSHGVNLGLNWSKINVTGGYMSARDNVADDPSRYTTSNDNANVNLMWNPLTWLSINLGYQRDQQNTAMESGFDPFIQDSITDQFSGSFFFNVSPFVQFNLSATNADLNSENNPQYANTNLTLNLGGNFRYREWITLIPNLGYSENENKFMQEKMQIYNAFLTTELIFIPSLLSASVSGGYSQTEMRSYGTSSNINATLSLNSYLDSLIKVGQLILALRGNYSSMESPGFSDSFLTLGIQADFSF